MRAASPMDMVRAELRGTLTSGQVERLPRSYFRAGDILILDLPLPGPEARVARAYARALSCRSVLGRVGGIEGEFRRPVVRLLWGDPRTETDHVENGVRYRFDPSRLMWSAGNLPERQRVASWSLAGETVVDCFAGVGYFALPLGRHAGAGRVVAVEKNPESYRFLVQNVVLNGLEHVVEPRLGDCRQVAPLGEADRVLLGLLPDSLHFVPHALRVLRPRGGVLHVHRVAPSDDAVGRAFAGVAEIVEREGRRPRLVGSHHVKSYAPRLDHVVVDVGVGA